MRERFFVPSGKYSLLALRFFSSSFSIPVRNYRITAFNGLIFFGMANNIDFITEIGKYTSGDQSDIP